MSQNSEAQIFIDLIDQALVARVTKVELLVQNNAFGAPQPQTVAVPGVLLCLGARQSIAWGRESGTRDQKQRIGEGIVLTVGSWMEEKLLADCEWLQIRFDADATRFAHRCFEKDAFAPSDITNTPASRHHSSTSRLDPCGREIYRLLLSPPRIGEAAYLCGLFEALLCKARETLYPALNGGKAQQTWRTACHFIEQHCDQPLSRHSVARQLNLHPAYLSQLFAAQGTESFGEFLLRVRLERAHNRLQTPGFNVAEIAHSSGFPDANYFSRAFKKRYGITPGRARSTSAPKNQAE